MFPKELMNLCDFDNVLRHELRQPLEGFPQATLEHALRWDPDGAAPHLRKHLIKGLGGRGREVVMANKSDTHFRPLSRLDFLARLGFRALSTLISGPGLPALDRSWIALSQFREYPANSTGGKYVVSCDVHNFYQGVRHADVVDQIVGLTGQLEVALVLNEALQGMMRGSVGLPQFSEVSDFISELVVSVAERRLLRKGYDVVRFNDDFRFVCSSYRESLDALEEITIELARLGLSLNDNKTFIFGSAFYKNWIARPDEEWAELAGRKDVSPLIGDSIYRSLDGMIFVDPGEWPAMAKAARAALANWSQHRAIGADDRLASRLQLDLVRRALAVLAVLPGEYADINILVELWHSEPQLSEPISSFVSAAGKENNPIGAAAVERLVGSSNSGYGSWQTMWLLKAVASVENIGGATRSFVLRALNAGTSSVASLGAVAAAQHRIIDIADVAAMFDKVDVASQPEIAASVAFLAKKDNDRRMRALRGEGYVLDQILKYNFDELQCFDFSLGRQV